MKDKQLPPLLVGVKVGAGVVGISESGMRDQIRLGRIRAVRVPGARGRVLIPYDELLAWARSLPPREPRGDAA